VITKERLYRRDMTQIDVVCVRYGFDHRARRLAVIPARLQHFEYLVHPIRGTIQVRKDPARGGRPSNILRQSLDRNRAQQGRMAGPRQLEQAALP